MQILLRCCLIISLLLIRQHVTPCDYTHVLLSVCCCLTLFAFSLLLFGCFIFVCIYQQAKGGDDSDEDSLFDDDDSDASSDDEDGRGELKGRARWLKKVVAVKSQEEEGNLQHIMS